MKYAKTSLLLLSIFFINAQAEENYTIDAEDVDKVSLSDKGYWTVINDDSQRYPINLSNGADIPTKNIDLNKLESIKIRLPSNDVIDDRENSLYPFNSAEIQMIKDGADYPALEQQHWMMFSVKFDSSFPAPDSWFLFSEVWQKDAGTPILSLGLSKRNQLIITIRNDDYPLDEGDVIYPASKNDQIDVNYWMTFVINFKGSLNGDGYLKIWRKTEPDQCYEQLVNKSNIKIGKTFYTGTNSNGSTYYPKWNELGKAKIPLEKLKIVPKIGLYRGGSDLVHEVYYDNIRYQLTGQLFYDTPPLCE